MLESEFYHLPIRLSQQLPHGYEVTHGGQNDVVGIDPRCSTLLRRLADTRRGKIRCDPALDELDGGKKRQRLEFGKIPIVIYA
ncbi:MAG: hypothetical protein V1723_01555 [Candidatus Uhrbacteria bacterium]